MSGTSTTTRDKEIARNPHPPEGLGRDGPISLLLLLADVSTSTRRRASIWARPAPNKRYRIYDSEYQGYACGRRACAASILTYLNIRHQNPGMKP